VDVSSAPHKTDLVVPPFSLSPFPRSDPGAVTPEP